MSALAVDDVRFGRSSANNAIVYCLINDINGSRPLKNISYKNIHIFLHCIGALQAEYLLDEVTWEYTTIFGHACTLSGKC